MRLLGLWIPTLTALCYASNAEQTFRELRDSTPTPCRKEYDSSFIADAAKKHMQRYATDTNCDVKEPRMLLLLGGSGAGKGTLLRHLSEHGMGALIPHGLDEYLEYLPEFQETVQDTQFIYKDAADACYGGGAIPIAKAVQQQIVTRKCNLFYEETGKNLKRIKERVLPPFVDAGYAVTIVLVDNLPSIAIERAAGREQKEGRHAPSDYIEGTFKGVFDNYLSLREDNSVSESAYCDNSCLQRGSDESPSATGSCLKCWQNTKDRTDDSLVPLLPSSALRDEVIKVPPKSAAVIAARRNEL